MITVNEEATSWTPGMTVRDVLKVKNYQFRMLVIKIDETLILPAAYDTTPVPDGAVVNVLHLISGG